MLTSYTEQDFEYLWDELDRFDESANSARLILIRIQTQFNKMQEELEGLRAKHQVE